MWQSDIKQEGVEAERVKRLSKQNKLIHLFFGGGGVEYKRSENKEVKGDQ